MKKQKFSDIPVGDRFYYIGPWPAETQDDSRGVWEKRGSGHSLSFLSDGIHSLPTNAVKITGVMVGAVAEFSDEDLIRAVEPEDFVPNGA